MRKFTCLLIILFTININAQEISHYNNDEFNPFNKIIYSPGKNIHTSVKPLNLSRIREIANVDSLIYRGMKTPDKNTGFWRRIFCDDLLRWNKNDVNIKINPLFNFGVGKELINNKNLWTNTRGVFIEGTFGKNFYFFSDFRENQAVFPNYINEFIHRTHVVPGSSKSKTFRKDKHDFSMASGFISFNPDGKWFNIQLGNGKQFIGDGYRSLLLSDVSYNYPYMKFSADFNKVHYHVLWAQLRDLNIGDKLEGMDAGYKEKYMASNYLTINVGNRFSFGFFENVVWAAKDTMGVRNFDLAYLNPIIFFRPLEYSLGSPDNITMGVNTKFIVGKNSVFYGQFVLGEFKFDEVFSGNKWWANKQGFQVGFKSYDVFGIPNLYFQTEYNQVRPYTYSHRETITNYANYNQALAHPLGANFRESVSIVRYRYKRIYLNSKVMYAMYGKDTDENVSYGGDIFKDNDLRPEDYNCTIGQGLKTNLLYLEGSLSYLINPKNNFNIALGARYRKETNDEYTNNTKLFWFAIRTSLTNFYSDR